MYARVDVVDGDTVLGRWFELWTGAVAISAICVRLGKAGVSTLGGGLHISLNKRFSAEEANLYVSSSLNGTRNLSGIA